MNEPRCPACREVIATGLALCPHCAEPLRPRGRDIASFALAGLALGLFLLGAVTRLVSGPLPDLASVARSLRFLEVLATAVFLLLLARAVRR